MLHLKIACFTSASPKLHLRFTSVLGTFFWRFAETSHIFPDFPVFSSPKVLLATRTCLTQAGASVSNTFWHPVLSGHGRSETTDCHPTGDREPTDCPPHRQSVDGSDFLSLSEEALTNELRLTPFAAKKLLKAREVFLNSP